MDYAGRGFKGQFKSADRFKATYSLLLGEDEVKGEYVNIRDNKTKEQEQVPFEDIVSYLEKGLGL
jgi:histidyl-tRNA synthetase